MTQSKEKTNALPLSVRLCSDKASFEALVLRKVVFNMDEAKKRLEKERDCKIMVYTPHLMVLRHGEAEVTLSKDGRMLIKRVRDEDEAEEVVLKVWQIILNAQC